MPATLLDGKALARTMQAEIAAGATAFVHTHGTRPGLAAVLVGDNPASQLYVGNKRKQCQQVGIDSWLHHLPADTTQAQLLDLIARLGVDVTDPGFWELGLRLLGDMVGEAEDLAKEIQSKK